MTYFLISAVGENIQYQRNSSVGISIFLGNTLHLIQIQWHFELPFWILGSKIPVNILPPDLPSKEDVLLRLVHGNQIPINTYHG